MEKQRLYMMIGLTLLSVFLLSILWEFGFEETVYSWFGQKHATIESDGEKWEYIITATAFVAIGLFLSFLISQPTLTKHRRVEKALRESEERFQTLISSADHGILAHRNWVPLYANQKLADMYGYDSAEEIMALASTKSLTHQNYRHDNHKRRLIGENLEPDYEVKGLRKDGTEIWEERRSFIIDWDGEPAVCSMRLDISKRKKVELELRQTRDELERRVEERTEELNAELKMRKKAEEIGDLERRRLADAVNSFKDGFALYDAEDKLVICNENYLAAMDDVRDYLKPGITFEAFLRIRADRGLRQDGIVRDEASIQNRMKEHLNPTGPLERQFDDGRTFQIHEFKTHDGGIAVVRINVTDLKTSEQELRQSQERLSNAIESLNEGFAYYDADDRLVTFNEHYAAHHRSMGSDLKAGVTWGELIRGLVENKRIPAAAGREEEYIAERIALHRNFKEPLVTQKDTGMWIMVTESLTPDGGTVLSILDVTKLKNTEDELRQAKAIADEASRAKSTFLAAASHDVRQPLQALGMFLSVLGDKLSTPPIKNNQTIQILVARMNDSVSALSGLFNSLLDVSKLESQTLDPEISEFDVGELISRLSGQFEPQAKAKGLILKTKTAELRVRSDEALLSQVLSNFLGNAIHYTDEGEILFSVRLRKNHVGIQVTDSGIGIAKEKIDHIFEDFYQVGNEQRDRTKGMGLGLSIAKRTADLLGLYIAVRSEEGVGSTFAIQMPVVEPSDINAIEEELNVRKMSG